VSNLKSGAHDGQQCLSYASIHQDTTENEKGSDVFDVDTLSRLTMVVDALNLLILPLTKTAYTLVFSLALRQMQSSFEIMALA
jgi:uncharacterized protein involved in cysteine biosynthesis